MTVAEILKETLEEAFCSFYAWITMPYLLFLFIFIKKLLDKFIL